ncbi:MAG: HD domain-containing protein, partial [Phycisphaerales bacterium]|nr:HD domain-containing protein [Phycisphaerales bacterium]
MPKNWDIVIVAASMAAKLHGGQARKDGTPYFQHPARVATLLARAGADDELVAAGFLHDVIEDTPADYDDIAEKLGTDVADWVSAMSKDHRMAEPVREPAYKKQLRKGPWQGRAIKLADQIDNFSASKIGSSRVGRRRLEAANWALEITESDEQEVILKLRATLQGV